MWVIGGSMEANGGHGLQNWLNGRATEGIWGLYEGHLRQLWTEHESQQQSDKHVEARELKLLVLKKTVYFRNTVSVKYAVPVQYMELSLELKTFISNFHD